MAMRIFLSALLTALVTLLCACVPTRFSGYTPQGAGELEIGYCVAGIKDVLRFKAPSGVDLVISTHEMGSKGPSELYIYLEIPAGVTVRLMSTAVVLQSPEWAADRTVEIRSIDGDLPPRLPDQAVTGAQRKRRTQVSISFVRYDGTPESARWQPGIPFVKTFSARLPDIDIDGQVFRPGIVTFERYRKWGMYYCAQ